MVGKQRSIPRGMTFPQLTNSLAGVSLFALSAAVLANQGGRLPLGGAADGGGNDGDTPMQVAQAAPLPLTGDYGAQAEGPLPEPAPGRSSGRGLRVPGVSGQGRPSREVPGILPPASPETAEGRQRGDANGERLSPTTGKDSQKEESTDGEIHWQIPPIRWGGSVGYSLQRSSSGSGQSSLSQGLFGNLNAASYIYAPWAATVAGRLGLTTASSSSHAGNAGSQSVFGNDTQSRNLSVVGGGELSVFPTSRFPFQAFFDRSDSRASGNLVTNDYVNTRFGLRQTYRGEDGYTNAGLQFDHSTVDSSLGGKRFADRALR